MTTTINPNPAPADGTSAASSAELAAALIAEAKGKKDGSGSSDGTKVETPEELEVDWNGTKRKVKVADLVKTAQREDELKQLDASLDRKLQLVANLDAFKAMQERLNGLTPVQRQRLNAILQEPNVLDDNEDDDDETDALEGAAAKNGREQPPAENKRLDKLEAGLNAIAQFLKNDKDQQRHEKQEKQVREQLAEQWENWPVLQALDKDDKEGAAYMRRSVLNALAAEPDKGLAKHVAEAATQVQRRADRHRREEQEQLTGGTVPQLPPKKFKGDDLTKGTVAREILAVLGHTRPA